MFVWHKLSICEVSKRNNANTSQFPRFGGIWQREKDAESPRPLVRSTPLGQVDLRSPALEHVRPFTIEVPSSSCFSYLCSCPTGYHLMLDVKPKNTPTNKKNPYFVSQPCDVQSSINRRPGQPRLRGNMGQHEDISTKDIGKKIG